MDKRGLIGKIALIIGIILGIVIGLIGYSVYQAASFIQETTKEAEIIKEKTEALLTTKNCSFVDDIEKSMSNIKKNAEKVCTNPFIEKFSERSKNIPLKCSQVQTMEEEYKNTIAQLRAICLALNIEKNLSINLPTLPPVIDNSTKNNKTILSDSELLRYAQSDYSKEEMSGKDFILGYHNNTPVRVSFPCADVCPEYTLRIIRYDINNSQCLASGGELKSILIPIAISVKLQELCFPKPVIASDAYSFA